MKVTKWGFEAKKIKRGLRSFIVSRTLYFGLSVNIFYLNLSYFIIFFTLIFLVSLFCTRFDFFNFSKRFVLIRDPIRGPVHDLSRTVRSWL